MAGADLPSFPLTPDGVTDALADLDKGGSEDVAERFEELGFKGQRDSITDDPLARYLRAVLPDAEYIQIDAGDVFVRGIYREDLGDGFINSWDVVLHVPLPDSVEAFVEDFDAGVYEFLIDSEVNADA